MDFLAFRERMYPMGCFHINQVLLWEKNFDRNNLTRWCGRGLLLKLRNQYYAFPEYLQMPDFSRYVANRIYSPSYISLHSALSFYGMIPEEVVQLTSVTTLKTARVVRHSGEGAAGHALSKPVLQDGAGYGGASAGRGFYANRIQWGALRRLSGTNGKQGAGAKSSSPDKSICPVRRGVTFMTPSFCSPKLNPIWIF